MAYDNRPLSPILPETDLILTKEILSSVGMKYKTDECNTNATIRSDEKKRFLFERTGSKINEQFWCHICSNNFPTKQELMDHDSTHMSLYETDVHNSTHLLLTETDITLAKGRLSTILGKSETDEVHYTINPGEKENAFLERTGLRMEEQFCCHICSISFPTKQELMAHDNSTHLPLSETDVTLTEEMLSTMWVESDSDESEVSLKIYQVQKEDVSFKRTDLKSNEQLWCQICSVSFSTEHELMIHGGIHVSLSESPLANKTSPWSDVTKDKDPVASQLGNTYGLHIKEKPHVCDVCSKGFAKKGDLKRHVLIHTREMTHRCEVCNKMFAHKSNYRRHFLTHTQEKPHVCNMCGKTFVQKSNLVKHFLIHTKEKPYTCEVCDRAFAQKSNLTKHLFIHTKERPYSCEVCQKTFAQRSNLRNHCLIHTKEKPHACEVCQRMFAQRSNLKDHMLTHTNKKSHVCHVCNKTFGKKCDLKRHYLIHTKERSHVCEVCHKNFALRSSLVKHSVIHTERKKHFCDVCSKVFVWKDSLRRHYLTHKGEKS